MKLTSLFLLLFGFLFIFLQPSYAGDWATSTVGSPGEYSASQQSMAMDHEGNLHIAYKKMWTPSEMRYATNKSGIWQTIRIDDRGEAASIALDSQNNVHIIYFTQSPENGLRYATNSSGSWKVTTIDPEVNVDFVYTKSTAIAIDSNDKVHACYYMATKTPLKYASNISGDWVSEIVDENATAGDIAVDSADGVHIVSGSIHFTNASGHWVSSKLDFSGASQDIAFDILDNLHIAYIKNGDLYCSRESSGGWQNQLIDTQSNTPALALDTSGKAHIVYHRDVPSTVIYNLQATKYATNASGDWITETVDPYEDLPEYFIETYYDIGQFGARNSIAIDADGSAHISYQAWVDMTQNILRYATNKPSKYNISGEWKFSTTNNWSACEPDENSKGTLIIQQDGHSITATSNDIAENPAIFKGRAAGSIYELFAEFPEDNGSTLMIVSIMASSNSYGIGPQIWLYRESPSYCYGGSSIEYQKSSSGVPGSTGSSGDGAGGCFINSSR